VTEQDREAGDRLQGGDWLQLLQASVEAAAHGIVITDRWGRIVWVNPAFAEMTGYGRDEIVGRNPRILKSGEQDEAFYEELWSTILRGETWQGEIVNRRKDGSLYTEHQSVVPVRHESGEITHFIAIKEDISELKARQRRLEELSSRLSGLLETAAGIIFRVRLPDMGVTYISPNIEEVTGYPAVRWTEEPTFWMKAVPEEDLRRMIDTVESAVSSGAGQAAEEYRLNHADGSQRWYRAVVRFERDGSGRATAFVGTSIDVTERRELEDRLRHLALHDPLTDLANRTLLADRLKQAIARAESTPRGWPSSCWTCGASSRSIRRWDIRPVTGSWSKWRGDSRAPFGERTRSCGWGATSSSCC
jgi:PAS domain S-box-containing protein